MLQVMMANERVNEDEAEAILSNLKMEGRNLVGPGSKIGCETWRFPTSWGYPLNDLVT